jgi:hypothetical protein
MGWSVDSEIYIAACPRCKSGTMIRIVSFDAHAPPLDMLQKNRHRHQDEKSDLIYLVFLPNGHSVDL